MAVALPSILVERNRTVAWAHRFWVVEERRSLPLVFDATRQGHQRCAATYSNLAVTRVPSRVEEDAFLVAVRGHGKRGQRWGSTVAVGVLRAKSITQLLQKQPVLEMALPDRPKDTLDANAVVDGATNGTEEMAMPTTAKKYQEALQFARNTHVLYEGGVQDQDVWKRTMCCVHGVKDVRLFYRATNNGTDACMVTVVGKNGGARLLCMDRFHISVNHTVGTADTNKLCPRTVPLAVASKELGKRNTVPLVRHNSLAWPGHPSDLVWLMDAMGGNDGQPHLFAVNVSMRAKTENNTGRQHTLRDCEYLKGWRGNSPVLQFSDYIWITIVHKYKKGQRSKVNQLGRTYYNKVVLFEADFPTQLPRRCLRVGPEASGRDLFQRQPAMHLDWPFAFVLGLLHLGVVNSYQEGEEHAFLVSAGVDDFQPAMKVFSVFVPRRLLRR